MSLRISLVAVVAACVVSHAGLAQTSVAASGPVGVWRGTSRCLVRPSACNDEVVVYRITRMCAADSASVDARKIVSGQEQEMGVLGCKLSASDTQIECTIPRGVWRFTVRRDSMVGDLRLPDSTKFRDVRTARAR